MESDSQEKRELSSPVHSRPAKWMGPLPAPKVLPLPESAVLPVFKESVVNKMDVFFL